MGSVRAPTRDRLLGRLRGTTFAALALFVAVSPAWGQVFGGRGRLLRSWRMFADPGRGLVDARFSLRSADGRERPVDRYALLGLDPPRVAPDPVRRPRGIREFEALAHQLCDRLGPGADLRARARIAARDGWRPVTAGERSLCLPPPDARAGS